MEIIPPLFGGNHYFLGEEIHSNPCYDWIVTFPPFLRKLTDAPFFCTLRTNKRLVPLDIQRVIKRTSESLGFEITPHDLRHTYAAELYRATQDLKLVQACLGLSSLRAVRMYRHHTKVEVEASGL